MTELAEDSALRHIRPSGLVSRHWPVVAGGLVALLFASHLLTTSEAFVWSGTDIVAIEYPLRALAHSRLAEGDLPLWNPYHLGGTPFQTGVHGYLSPSFWTTVFDCH